MGTRTAILLLTLAAAAAAGCITPQDRDLPPEWPFMDSSAANCTGLRGTYSDDGQASATNRLDSTVGRRYSLADVLQLDPRPGGDLPADELQLVVDSSYEGRLTLTFARVLATDRVALVQYGGRCLDGTELRLDIPARYESRDGVQVQRQTMRISLFQDTESNLIVRREVRERSLGLVDLRSGGVPIAYFRFHRTGKP